jgi:hypothetical protein
MKLRLGNAPVSNAEDCNQCAACGGVLPLLECYPCEAGNIMGLNRKNLEVNLARLDQEAKDPSVREKRETFEE